MPVRMAIADDADAIRRVQVDTWRSAYRGVIPDALLDSMTYGGDVWRRNIAAATGPRSVHVADEPEHGVVGFASSGPELSGDPVYRGELYAIYVLRERQGSGVGRALIRAAATALADHGLTSMLVWVLHYGPARAWYEALGGVLLPFKEKREPFGDVVLHELAYGWTDTASLRA